MAQTTLAQYGVILNDEIVSPIIKQVVKSNQIFEYIPSVSFTGASVLITSRADKVSQTIAEGANFPAAVAAALTQKTVLSKYIAETADVTNAAIAHAGGYAGAMAVQLEISADAVGATLQDQMFNGGAAATDLDSLFTQTTNLIAPADAVLGDPLTFQTMSKLVNGVRKNNNGRCDFITMSWAQLENYLTLQRSLGGNAIQEVIGLGGESLYVFQNVKIFPSYFLNDTETVDGLALVGGTWASIYAGVFDNGNLTNGVALVYPENTSGGLEIINIGQLEGSDNKRAVVKYTGNFVVCSPNAVVRAYGII